MSEKLWVYHESEAPKVIDESKWSEYEFIGWAQSPADFLNLDDLGIDKDDPLVVHEFGVAVAAIATELNETINNLPDFEEFSRDELAAWADDNLDIEFPDEVPTYVVIEKILKYACD